MPLSFRQLQVVHTILDTGSVTQAAEVLGISRPAVSMMLAECTSTVGFPLFTRTGGAMVPTEEARALMPDLQRLMTARQDIEKLLLQLANVEVGRLNIASVPTLTEHVLPQALSNMAQRHPNILTSVQAMRAGEVVEAVIKKRVHLGLSIASEPVDGIELRTLCSGAAICVVRRDHPLARLAKVDPEHLLTSPQISVPRSSVVGKLIDAAFGRIGVPWQPQFEVTNAAAACAFARAGLGVAIVDPLSVPPLGDPHLCAVELNAPITMDVQLVLPSASRPSRATRLLVGAVSRAIDELASEKRAFIKR